ncbi:MAG: hypothetical protein EOM78_08345 [Erysipelotrichia bacterium]|nr:hypothetical protein [Erysipelotrichia bacterium]
MFKNISLLFMVLIFIVGCSVNQVNVNNSSVQEKKIEREPISKEFLDEISYILFLLKNNDLATLNLKYINPKIGVYEVFKSDINNKVVFRRSLQIGEISDFVEDFDIKQETVDFNCSPDNDAYYGWSKEGIFLSVNIKPYLSQIIEQEHKILPNKYKENELKLVELIEKTSYELVVTNNTIFYLTKIDSKWYITLIDNLKTDCSH